MRLSTPLLLEDDESKARGSVVSPAQLVLLFCQAWLNLMRLCPPLSSSSSSSSTFLFRSCRLRPPTHKPHLPTPSFILTLLFWRSDPRRSRKTRGGADWVIAHGRIEFHGAGEDEGLLPARHDAGGGRRHLRRPVQAAHAAGAAPHRLLAQGLRLAHGVAPPGPTHHLRPQVAEQHAAGQLLPPYQLSPPFLDAPCLAPIHHYC